MNACEIHYNRKSQKECYKITSTNKIIISINAAHLIIKTIINRKLEDLMINSDVTENFIV